MFLFYIIFWHACKHHLGHTLLKHVEWTSVSVAEKVKRLRGGLEQEEHLSKTIKRSSSKI